MEVVYRDVQLPAGGLDVEVLEAVGVGTVCRDELVYTEVSTPIDKKHPDPYGVAAPVVGRSYVLHRHVDGYVSNRVVGQLNRFHYEVGERNAHPVCEAVVTLVRFSNIVVAVSCEDDARVPAVYWQGKRHGLLFPAGETAGDVGIVIGQPAERLYVKAPGEALTEVLHGDVEGGITSSYAVKTQELDIRYHDVWTVHKHSRAQPVVALVQLGNGVVGIDGNCKIDLSNARWSPPEGNLCGAVDGCICIALVIAVLVEIYPHAPGVTASEVFDGGVNVVGVAG